MAVGRTLNRYSRVYIGGYDLSGYARSIGPLSCIFQEGVDDPLSADIVGTWLGRATINPGTLNGIFDTTAITGIHALMKVPGVQRNVLVAQGIRAVPAIGDPIFCGQFQQDDYLVGPGETPSIATIKFSSTSGADMGATTSLANYAQPWGILLHTNVAASAVNTGEGVDQLAVSHLGGYMMYQVTTAAGNGDIRATIKVQNCATSGGTYTDLLSSGIINCGAGGVAVPTSGVVALATNADVLEFVRWQVVFSVVGGHECTSVTFVLAFVKNYI